MKSITSLLVITLLFGTCNSCKHNYKSVKLNDTIIEKKYGFPFRTYENWLNYLKSHKGYFDEKRFKNSYPKQNFDKYKNKIDYIEIKYLSDGLKVVAYIVKPKSTDGKKLPVIIYNRGGNRSFAQLTFGTLYQFFELVSQGYILVASQYRGNAGGEGQEEFGGSDINDVLNLIPVINSLPEADTSRIGMYGWSRGGMMTYIALTKTDRISAAVVGAGMTDLFDAIKQRPEMENSVFAELIPNYWEVKGTALEARSALYWPEKLCKTTPILILHGSSDWRVDPTQALRMASALYQIKHPFRFVFFEGGDHGLNEHRDEVNNLVKDWFDNYLRDQNPLPDLELHGK